MKRETVTSRSPIMITVKLKSGLRNLRCGVIHEQLKKGFLGAKKFGFRVVHYSLEGNHVHIFAEVDDKDALAKGMMSFGSSFGKAIRKFNGGTGPVFMGRYHVRVLKNPTQTKQALAYVLFNRAKHTKWHPEINEYSSNVHFKEWDKLLGKKRGPVYKGYAGLNRELPSYLSPPRSWLAKAGWMKSA